ncbi:uncharacterized protein Bdp1 [Epargyreus clarus]|uniref:uncharacterized protein Bdp1 n=1 Tax=Epargyreus clarus TaxID=520877 RepID=UPI003C2D2AD9
MSTRRARIKAVTSLPVRRKNAEAADNSKSKEPVKEIVEKVPKSPRTPRALKTQDEKKSGSPVISTSPIKIKKDIDSVITCRTNDKTLDVKVSPSCKTPQRAEKVSVITPNLNYKPSSASPRTRGNFASPLAPSPKVQAKAVGVIVQRPVTPLTGKTPAAHTIDENNELQISSKNVNSVVYNSVSSKSIASDDYNVPSVPESVENDGVMDGIVPLQAERNAPKPIDLLKNEIISENAEVLFDPIIPLPSPSKVRPKLRPTPRLGPHRRSSIQGSASESEDENRRYLSGANTPGLGRQRRDSHTSFSTLNSVPNRDTHRKRNDSVCSNVSQATTQPGTSSPVKDKSYSKTRRREVSRRMAAVRRRRETLKRDALTMYDLIFYNPTSNPLVPNQDEVKAKLESMRDEEEAKTQKIEKEKKEKEENKDGDSSAKDAGPVPQIKLGPNGEIILDKSSLVIKQTDAKRDVSTVVREGSWLTGPGRYYRAARTAEWKACETVRFYRALAAIGTDFSLMAPLFPDRTRRELKLKFKKEEKINGNQVDKALRAGNSWDPNRLKEQFQCEREEAAKKAKKDAEKLQLEKMKEKERLKNGRELRVRNSRAAKALESTMLPGVSNQRHNDISTADDLVKRVLQSKKKRPVGNTNVPTTPTDVNSSMATLTLINNGNVNHGPTKNGDNMATISRVTTPVPSTPVSLNTMPNVPSNIETGSLVVLTVNDPSSPSKKMLQTYIAHSEGRLTPVSLPPTFLNSVVGYMKKGTPKSTVSSCSSPQLTSPSSVISQDSRTSVATPVINLNPSPRKRKRINSYTITQL